MSCNVGDIPVQVTVEAKETQKAKTLKIKARTLQPTLSIQGQLHQMLAKEQAEDLRRQGLRVTIPSKIQAVEVRVEVTVRSPRSTSTMLQRSILIVTM